MYTIIPRHLQAAPTRKINIPNMAHGQQPDVWIIFASLEALSNDKVYGWTLQFLNALSVESCYAPMHLTILGLALLKGLVIRVPFLRSSISTWQTRLASQLRSQRNRMRTIISKLSVLESKTFVKHVRIEHPRLSRCIA